MPKDDRAPAFKYRGRTGESVARRAKQASGSYDSYLPNDVLSFKPREGENCIRILAWNVIPGKEGDDLAEKWGDHWGIDIFTHFNVGPDEQSYLCLDKMKGEPCPVCEARRTGTEEEADALRAGNRILCWLIDRNDEKAGPKIWSMPLGVSNDISAASQVKGSGEILLIDDPDEGYDVYFDREGERKRTKYKRIEVAREPTPVHDDPKVQDRWLNYIADPALPDVLVYFEPDHIEKVLFGQSGKDDSGEEQSSRRGGRGAPAEEEAPRSSRRGGRGEPAEEETTRPSRGRRGEAEPEAELPAGRGRHRGEPEPEPDEETSQDYGHEGEEAAQSARGRGARRGEPVAEAPSRTRRRPTDEPAEEPEAPAPRGRERTSERRRPAAEPEGEDEGAETTTAAAKERLGRLGRRGR